MMVGYVVLVWCEEFVFCGYLLCVFVVVGGLWMV